MSSGLLVTSRLQHFRDQRHLESADSGVPMAAGFLNLGAFTIQENVLEPVSDMVCELAQCCSDMVFDLNSTAIRKNRGALSIFKELSIAEFGSSFWM